MFQQPDPSDGQLSLIFFGKICSNNDQLKPFQNRKGQKNFGYPTKKQSFSKKKKTAFLLTRQKSNPFLRNKRLLFCQVPSHFEMALVDTSIDRKKQIMFVTKPSTFIT